LILQASSELLWKILPDIYQSEVLRITNTIAHQIMTNTDREAGTP